MIRMGKSIRHKWVKGPDNGSAWPLLSSVLYIIIYCGYVLESPRLFMILKPTSDFHHNYYLLGANLESLFHFYGDVPVVRSS